MTLTRKNVIAAGAALAAVAVIQFPGEAAEFNLKFANDEGLEHPLSIRAQQAIAQIKQQSNGRVDIAFFPNNQLGGASQQLTQVRGGAIDILEIGDNILANVVPSAAISNVPFAFKTFADAYKAMDGPLGSYVRTAIDGVGLYAFSEVWNNGYRQTTTSSTAIKVPDDLHGLKIRVPPAPLDQQLFKALGASPTSIDGSEMYAAAQTHVVDGTDLPLAAIESYKIYEVQKELALTRHIWTGYWLVANKDSWAKLPADLRTMVESSFNAAGAQERRDIERLEQSLATTLTGKGMTLSTPDLTAFQAALRKVGAYQQWQHAFGQPAWSMLEKTTGPLA